MKVKAVDFVTTYHLEATARDLEVLIEAVRTLILHRRGHTLEELDGLRNVMLDALGEECHQ